MEGGRVQDAAQTSAGATDTAAVDAAADAFIARWQGVTASELSTSQSFLIDLCRLLEVEVPHPTPEQDYMFERPITFRHSDGGRSAGRSPTDQSCPRRFAARFDFGTMRKAWRHHCGKNQGEVMFKGSLFALIAAVLFASGCASVPMAPASEDAALKTFAAPEEGMAGVYIYRNSFVGQALKKNLYLNGEFIGESANKTYFYRQVEPGEHTISTESEFSDNSFRFVAEAGLNYFIRQYIKMGVFVGGANLELVSEEEGKKGVLSSSLAK